MAVATHLPVLGALTGGVEALRETGGEPGVAAAIETIGGVLAGIAGTYLYAATAAQQPGSGFVAPGSVTMGPLGTLPAAAALEWQADLRSLADDAAKRAQNADDALAQLGLGIAEVVFRLLAGATVGLPAGYISQLALHRGACETRYLRLSLATSK